MSKAELFNFSSNLKEIVGNDLKEYGFKIRKNRMLRESDEYIDEIYYMRSLCNMEGMLNEFYLELIVHEKKRNVEFGIRLNYPSKIEPPKFFINNLKLPIEERRKEFTTEEDEESMIWVMSLLWIYTTEEELIDNFKVSKDIILTKGLKYFEEAKKIINRGDDFLEIRKEINSLSDILNNRFWSKFC